MIASSATRPVVTLINGFGDYQVQMTDGIDRALREVGVPLLVICTDGRVAPITSALLLDFVRHGEPLGVIIPSDVADSMRPDLLGALAESGLPVVTTGVKYGSAPCVTVDNDTGMCELLGHILDERALRRPVLARGIAEHPDSVRREEVIRHECARRGIAIDEDLVIEAEFQMKPAYDTLHRLLDRRRDFDCVIAFNDTSALGVMAALRDFGLRLPEDVAVSGFDNMGIAEQLWPPLTTVDQQLDEQGAMAVELLLRLVAGETDIGDVVVPSRLVRRLSTTGERPSVDLLLPVATALQVRTGVHENALHLDFQMANCHSVDELTAVLDTALPEAKIRRAFLALNPLEGTEGPHLDGTGERSASLVFSYRDARREPPPEGSFTAYRLLPSALRPELTTGSLVLQTLCVEGRERGHWIYEMVVGGSPMAEAVRLGLPRLVDTMLSSQELENYASTLELMVAERTRELGDRTQELAQRTSELERANEALERLVMLDGLTGIANRKAFEHTLQQAWRRTEEGYLRIALLMVDVDLFKAYNDHYGHLAGDAALQVVASCLAGSVRASSDLACRYGGEEFAVVLRDCDVEGALRVARRFMSLLAQAAVPHRGSSVAPVITASIGVAVMTAVPGDDPKGLIKAADDALYEAKLHGRNRLVVAEVPRVPTCLGAGTTPEPPREMTQAPRSTSHWEV